jgi:hypothetical protein
VSAFPRHLNYDAGGITEQVLCFGDVNAARRILIIPPLFDEMNRVRRVLVSTMRELAQSGVASYLPDFPGTNESLSALSEQSLETWQAAMALAAEQLHATHIASIRGGALIDSICPDLPHWRLAPANGGSLLKMMLRTRIAGDKESGKKTTIDDLMNAAKADTIELAGSILGPAMIAQIGFAQPTELQNLRTLTLGDGPDQLLGSALWLRAEPQDDPGMARSLCAELNRWSAQCGE